MKHSSIRIIEHVFPIFIGISAFLLVVGYPTLDPTNIAWLREDDLATHFLGWHFYASSSWAFPVGLNPNYGLEISSSIVFTDSNPLLAFIFKPFFPLLSNPFQYFGLWLLVSYMLQAWFG
jgi:hypothetical protein